MNLSQFSFAGDARLSKKKIEPPIREQSEKRLSIFKTQNDASAKTIDILPDMLADRTEYMSQQK